jgi:hypothetical protein
MGAGLTQDSRRDFRGGSVARLGTDICEQCVTQLSWLLSPSAADPPVARVVTSSGSSDLELEFAPSAEALEHPRGGTFGRDVFASRRIRRRFAHPARDAREVIDLEALTNVLGMPEETVTPLAHRAAVALERRHQPGVHLTGMIRGTAIDEEIGWRLRTRGAAAYEDINRVTEEGAEAIGLALVWVLRARHTRGMRGTLSRTERGSGG